MRTDNGGICTSEHAYTKEQDVLYNAPKKYGYGVLNDNYDF